MKHLLTFFSFFICISASAQLLKPKYDNIQLPMYISLLEHKTFKTDCTLKINLKDYAFSIDQLDKMRREAFTISTKNINKTFSYLEIPSIDLNKELRKVMHKVPGEYGPVRAEGFTL